MADFATVAELELRTGMVGLGARGTAVLADVSAQIRLHTGQDLDVVTGRQEEFAGEGQYFITLTQEPVTAVSAITVDGVAFTDWHWSRYDATRGIRKTDWTAWDDGPIIVTYDSGFASTEDEMLGVKAICIEAASRALGGFQETFGIDVVEERGAPYVVSFSEEEERFLDRFAPLVTG